VGCVEAPGAELSPCKAGRSGQTPGRLTLKLPISAQARLGQWQPSAWILAGYSPSSPDESRNWVIVPGQSAECRHVVGSPG
jgi:hypothetical protein